MLDIKNLSLTDLNTERKILSNISVEIGFEHINWIVADNGVGKTMMQKALLNTLPTNVIIDVHTEVRLFEQNILKLHPAKQNTLYGSIIAASYQNPVEFFCPNSTMFQSIKQSAKLASIDMFELKNMLDEFSGILNIKSLQQSLHLLPDNIANLDLKKYMLINLAISKPKLLLLDEIFSNLDYKDSTDLYNFLNYLRKSFDTTIIIWAHDNTNIIKDDSSIWQMSNSGIYKLNNNQRFFCKQDSSTLSKDILANLDYYEGKFTIIEDLRLEPFLNRFSLENLSVINGCYNNSFSDKQIVIKQLFKAAKVKFMDTDAKYHYIKYFLQIMNQLDFPKDILTKLPEQLSGSQLQACKIIKSLLQVKPWVLVLNVNNYFSKKRVFAILSILKEHQKKFNCSVIYAINQ